MKYYAYIICVLVLSSCIRWGAQSKYVKFDGYELVGDGNDNDSSFFEIKYRNNSDTLLRGPYLRMVIKDTSRKFFKPILYSHADNHPDVPAHSEVVYRYYAKGFTYTGSTGKKKFFYSWTNSKGKSSVRRSVR